MTHQSKVTPRSVLVCRTISGSRHVRVRSLPIVGNDGYDRHRHTIPKALKLQRSMPPIIRDEKHATNEEDKNAGNEDERYRGAHRRFEDTGLPSPIVRKRPLWSSGPGSPGDRQCCVAHVREAAWVPRDRTATNPQVDLQPGQSA